MMPYVTFGQCEKGLRGVRQTQLGGGGVPPSVGPQSLNLFALTEACLVGADVTPTVWMRMRITVW